MKRNKLCKIISMISAVALILCSLGISGTVLANSADNSGGLNLQEIVDDANLNFSNSTTKGDLERALQEISLPDGYSVEAVTDFYKIKAIDGAIEKGSTYEGAVDGEVLVPGEKGYISAVVIVSNGSNEYDSVITLVIEPEMEEYSFASCSSDEDFVYNSQSWADRWEYTPKSGKAAEKIIIPDKVTELKSDWNQYWNYGVTDTVRCVVFNENIEEIPGVTGNSWNELEVVAFKGNNLKKLASYTSSGGTTYGAFYNAAKLKHIRLPDSIKSIGDYTFYKCRSLTQLYLPEGLETIGEKVFFDGNADWSGQGHNLSEITVPASVTSIGRTAFAGALSDFTATVLTSSENVDEYAFVVWYGGDYNARTTLRALSGTSAANPTTTADNGSSHPLKGLELLEDEMTVAEAAARAKQRADKINGQKFGDADSILADMTAAYGNVSTISSVWKSEEWTENANRLENTLLITKGEITSEIKVSMLSGNFDLTPYIEAADIKISNSTTETELSASLNKVELPDGYSILSIDEFYILKSIDGAVDVSTEYIVSKEDRVILTGYDGYLSAVVSLNTPNGEEKASFVIAIKPDMVEYTFDSCSKESEFTIDSNGKLVSYNGRAEKIIVPEGVKTIAWDAFSDVKKTVRAVVLPESLRSLSTAFQSCYNLEVVYMGDNVTTVSNNAFESCHSLRNIRLSENLTAISDSMFRYVYNLFDIHIPDSVTEIKQNAFIRSSIRNAVLSENIKAVGDWAFCWLYKDSGSEGSPIEPSVKDKVEKYIEEKNMLSVPCTVTVLGSDTQFGQGNFDGNSYFTQIVVKAAENSIAYEKASSGQRINLDSITVTEASARVQQRVDKIGLISVTGTDKLKEIFTASYGHATGIKDEWKNRFWKQNGEVWENTLTLTKDDKLSEIKVSADIRAEDVQSALDNCDLKLSNEMTQDEFKSLIDGVLPGGYSVKNIKQYYKVRAIDGAVDVTSGRDILVEGHNGSVAAIIEVIGYDGEITIASVVKPITAVMQEYIFDSVSKSEDFEIEDGVLKKYSGKAEKVAIPEGVTTLASNWLSGTESKKDNYDAQDNTIRCIVYPESLTGTIPAQKELKALEVVSFKGDNVTELGEWAFFKAVNLKYIGLPSNLKIISKGALACGPNSRQTKLTAIYLPEGLEVIADNAFYWNSSDWNDRARQGLIEITIPESVKSIGNYAFAWPQKTSDRTTFTVTLLNKNTICQNAFPFENDGANIIIRSSKDSSAYRRYSSNSNITVFDLDNMTLTEAAARASVRIDELEKKFYSSDVRAEDISKQIISSYGSTDCFDYGFGDTWNTSIDGRRTGIFSLKDAENSFNIEIDLDVEPEYTLDGLVSAFKAAAKNLEFTNSVTEASLKDSIDAKMPGGYKVKISEYNHQRAVDGAKDNTGVLVAGYSGSVAAFVEISDYYGNTQSVGAEFKVKPTLEEYTFKSVSKAEDFLLSEDGKALIEYYGTAEKIVVPEGVETINADWMWGDPTVVKALILPESLKALPKRLCDGMYRLEVVSMYDNVVTVGENTFNECYSLKFVRLSENLEEISANMFSYTYSLFDLRIPDSVVYIGNAAFLRSSLRNITVSSKVEEVGEYAITFISKEAVNLGSSYFPIEDDIKNEIYDWVNENSYNEAEALPCVITFLGANTKVHNTNFSSGDQIYAKIIVRTEKNSEAYTVAESRIKNDEYADAKWKLEVLDMSLTEAIARANVKADALILYNGDKAESIEKYITDSYISSAVGKNVDWSTALKLTSANGNKAGSAAGVLRLSDITGKLTFDIIIDSKVLAERPKGLTGGELGDFWEDDLWDDDFSDDLFDDFPDDFLDDIQEDVLSDNPDDTPVNADKPDENKNKSKSKSEEFPWIWVIAGAGIVVLVCAGILWVLLVRKKKKKSK